MFRSIFTSLFLAVVLVAGTASAQGFPDDSFLCYKGKGSEKLAKGTQASLTDQFESGTFDVKKKRGVCNPADVDGAGIFAGTTHLAAYQIKGAAKHTKQTNIQVENQFGLITLDTIKEDRILVPAAQSTEGSVTAPNDADHNVDRYKCYKVKVNKSGGKFPKGIQASVSDAFTEPAKTFDVKKPKFLCNPVDVDGQGTKNPEGHLLCYQAKPAKGEPKQPGVSGIQNADEFLASDQVATKKEEVLCVPSTTNDPGDFVTYNTGLARGFIPFAVERTAVIAETLARSDHNVLCLQEVFQDEDVQTIIDGVKGRYPHSFWVPTDDPSGSTPACNADEVADALACITANGCETDPEGLITCAINNCSAEIFGLQATNEVCFNCLAANTSLETVAEIEEACLSGGGIFRDAGRNGVLLLSTLPLQNTDVLDFLNESFLTRRVVLYAEVERPVLGPVNVFCTHLTSDLSAIAPYSGNFASYEEEQAFQVTSMRAWMDEKAGPGGLVVGLGDFNTGPEIPPDIVGELPANYATLVGSDLSSPYVESASPECTFCNDNTLQTEPTNDVLIDHVLLRGMPTNAAFEARRLFTERVTIDGVPGESNLSDHFGVGVRITVE